MKHGPRSIVRRVRLRRDFWRRHVRRAIVSGMAGRSKGDGQGRRRFRKHPTKRALKKTCLHVSMGEPFTAVNGSCSYISRESPENIDYSRYNTYWWAGKQVAKRVVTRSTTLLTGFLMKNTNFDQQIMIRHRNKHIFYNYFVFVFSNGSENHRPCVHAYLSYTVRRSDFLGPRSKRRVR